jgi:hypothetical protein
MAVGFLGYHPGIGKAYVHTDNRRNQMYFGAMMSVTKKANCDVHFHLVPRTDVMGETRKTTWARYWTGKSQ